MRRKNPKFDNNDRRDDESRGSERRSSDNSRGRSEDRKPRTPRSPRAPRPEGDRRKPDFKRDGDRPSFGSRGSWSKSDNSDDRKKSFGDRKSRDFDSRGSSDRREFDRKGPRRDSDKGFSSDRPASREKFLDKTGYKDRDSRGSSDRREFERREPRRDSDKGTSFSDRASLKGKFGDRDDKRKSKFGEKSFADKKRSEYSSYGTKRKLRPRRKVENIVEDDGLIRLNKYIANSGMCSRRQADEYIKTGVVEVNGIVVTEMGFKVKPEDDVRFDGKRLTPERKTYVILNKPKGYITTTSDEKDRKTVMDLIAGATSTRLFPVGRLDRQTTGVLLFTNDGYLAKKLTHPSHEIKKIYHVILDRNLHGDDMEKIRQGIHMHEGIARVDKVSFIEGKAHNEIGVEIHIGWNRVVRRIFEKLGYKVEALDRVQFAGLTKKNLKRGDYRILDDKEVGFLKMM